MHLRLVKFSESSLSFDVTILSLFTVINKSMYMYNKAMKRMNMIRSQISSRIFSAYRSTNRSISSAASFTKSSTSASAILERQDK